MASNTKSGVLRCSVEAHRTFKLILMFYLTKGCLHVCLSLM